MKISPINYYNSIQKFNNQKAKQSHSSNPNISFQGAKLEKSFFYALGSTLVGILCVENNKKDDEEQPTYTDRDYHYDHPSPNDDWPDTAF